MLRKTSFAAVFLIIISFTFTISIQGAEPVQRSILRVDQLSCGSCLYRINAQLKTLSGYLGMEANLRRGLVAVDHRVSLESETISKAITSIGYPARVLSESKIKDNASLFSERGNQNAGCCATAPSGLTAQNLSGERPNSSEEFGRSRGYDNEYQRGVSSGGCCTISSTWRSLINRFTGKKDNN